MLSSIYQYATVAYIGGGFGKGIHNILEATAYNIPVCFGPNYHKFKEARDMIAIGAARSYNNADELSLILTNWLDNDEAGKLCLQALYRRYGDKVKDFSVVFRPSKDVNEYLQQLITSNKQQTNKTTLKL